MPGTITGSLMDLRRSKRSSEPGPYSFGADVTLADVFLVPQVANARRLKVPLEAFPKIVGIEAACLAIRCV